MAAPPPLMMEELIEDILLRMPPDDPAWLVRGALVCKQWFRLISCPAFRRRFHELHRTGPILGFLYNTFDGDPYLFGGDCTCCVAHLVRVRSPGSPHAAADLRGRTLGARHGRVLLYSMDRPPPDAMIISRDYQFVVWDPITDLQRQLPVVSWYFAPRIMAWNAAVLCAAVGSGA
ncbi:hypothetical protein BS78_06G006700 [Paspalum vaginatum]|nr:hypothetical protein BS78_06G006700 [Paspalum vaginatum]